MKELIGFLLLFGLIYIGIGLFEYGVECQIKGGVMVKETYGNGFCEK